jgi:heme-degrading monooxygenase HmoA
VPFIVIWEFVVQAGHEPAFEAAYGSSGDWVALFKTDTAYRNTRLVRDVTRERCYLTLDTWDSEAAYDQFRRVNSVRYEAIDRACEGWTEAETLVARASSTENRADL